MKGRKLGLDELMIINPSPKGGASMFYQPLNGFGLGSPPGYRSGLAEDFSAYPDDTYAGMAQYPDEMVAGNGQYYEEDPAGYGQYMEAPRYHNAQGMEGLTGEYGHYAEPEMGYADPHSAESMGDYGYLYDPEMGDYGQYLEDPEGYDGYATAPLDGYYREVPPPFNPRGDFGDQLSGYQAEKTVNPTCAFEKQAQVIPTGLVPAFFKPYF